MKWHKLEDWGNAEFTIGRPVWLTRGWDGRQQMLSTICVWGTKPVWNEERNEWMGVGEDLLETICSADRFEWLTGLKLIGGPKGIVNGSFGVFKRKDLFDKSEEQESIPTGNLTKETLEDAINTFDDLQEKTDEG